LRAGKGRYIAGCDRNMTRLPTSARTIRAVAWEAARDEGLVPSALHLASARSERGSESVDLMISTAVAQSVNRANWPGINSISAENRGQRHSRQCPGV